MSDKHSLNTKCFSQVLSRKGTGSLKWDRYKNTETLPFWVADMDFTIAPPIQKALEQRLAHPVYGYTVASSELGQAIAAHLEAEYGWKIELEWLVYLPGVVTGLATCCRAFCDDSSEIMVNPPIYQHFYDSHDDKRQTLLRVPLHKQNDRWTYDLSAMSAACTEKTTMLMMCSPHNPTGTVFTGDELRLCASLCEQHNMLMVSDEIHCDLVIDKSVKHVPTAVACPEYADRVVTLMSGSKTWNLAGLNCSFAIISNPELRAKFKQACVSVVPPVPPLALLATEVAYRDGGPWRHALLNYLADNYAFLKDSLALIPGLTLEPIQATYLAWIDASALNLVDTQAFFEQHGVGLSSGEGFGQPHYIRLNFACPKETLQEGVRRMSTAVASL